MAERRSCDEWVFQSADKYSFLNSIRNALNCHSTLLLNPQIVIKSPNKFDFFCNTYFCPARTEGLLILKWKVRIWPFSTFTARSWFETSFLMMTVPWFMKQVNGGCEVSLFFTKKARLPNFSFYTIYKPKNVLK